MSGTPDLWVLVDDTDPGILYSQADAWAADTNIVDAFQQTATFTSAPQASFSYRFNGSKVALFSPFWMLIQNVSHQTPHPSWECFLDNKSVPTNNSFTNFPIQSLCEIDNLDAGGHVIALQVGTSTGLGGDVPLYFDYIKLYLPFDPATISSNSITSLSVFNPQSQLGPNWSNLGTTNAVFTIGNGDSESSAILSITFTGTGLEWYGLSTSAISQALLKTSFTLNLAQNSLNYTIDINSDKSFEAAINFKEPSAVSAYDSMLFRTPQLNPGSHTLTVFFRGGATRTPLTLDFLAFSGTSAGFSPPSSVNAMPANSTCIDSWITSEFSTESNILAFNFSAWYHF